MKNVNSRQSCSRDLFFPIGNRSCVKTDVFCGNRLILAAPSLWEKWSKMSCLESAAVSHLCQSSSASQSLFSLRAVMGGVTLQTRSGRPVETESSMSRTGASYRTGREHCVSRQQIAPQCWEGLSSWSLVLCHDCSSQLWMKQSRKYQDCLREIAFLHQAVVVKASEELCYPGKNIFGRDVHLA